MPKKQPKKPSKSNLYFLASVCVVILILALSLFNVLLYSTPSRKSIAGSKIEINATTPLLQKKFFWEDFLKENPTYLQGWIELAKTQVQLENPSAARKAFEKAIEIDPNSELVNEAEKSLGLFRR